jgi:hypothetical protein
MTRIPDSTGRFVGVTGWVYSEFLAGLVREGDLSRIGCEVAFAWVCGRSAL